MVELSNLNKTAKSKGAPQAAKTFNSILESLRFILSGSFLHVQAPLEKTSGSGGISIRLSGRHLEFVRVTEGAIAGQTNPGKAVFVGSETFKEDEVGSEVGISVLHGAALPGMILPISGRIDFRDTYLVRGADIVEGILKAGQGLTRGGQEHFTVIAGALTDETILGRVDSVSELSISSICYDLNAKIPDGFTLLEGMRITAGWTGTFWTLISYDCDGNQA